MRIGLAGVGRIGAFHAATLSGLDAVDEVVVTDADPELAEKVAAELGLAVAPDVASLLRSGIDGFVITTATPGHAPLLREGVAAGIPTFCEKPVAATLVETLDLTRLAESSDVPVHIGFQRRFDAGYRRAREAVLSGELGLVHAVRATTHDQAPPHAGLHPDERRPLPGLLGPRLRHRPLRHRARGRQRLRHRREQGRALLRRGR